MSFNAHPAIAVYQSTLSQLKSRGHSTESQTRRAFAQMLSTISNERGLTYVDEFPVGKRGQKRVDGAVLDRYSSLGYWEAKDEYDDLQTEIKTKIAAGYPLNNTIFEDTNQAILWQNQKEVARFNLRENTEVSVLLHTFFHHTEEDKEGFDAAVTLFVDKIPELARGLMEKINHESGNATFQKAFGGFVAICKSALDPAIKEEVVKEMLVQYSLQKLSRIQKFTYSIRQQ